MSVGLRYQVLMAADILLYDADQVPVGEDQNSTWNSPETLRSSGSTAALAARTPVLKVPKPMIMKEGAR